MAALVLSIAGLALLASFRSPSELAVLTTTEAREPGRADVRAEDSAARPAASPSDAQAQQVISGQTVDTPFGPVQVQVTLAGDRIEDVEALQLPHDRKRSAYISQVAEPMLQEEALRVQFDSGMRLVSGATYTSRAYATSLQSALDRLG